MIKAGLGQDSHRFAAAGVEKPLVLGGVVIAGERGLDGNSDADVILHALTNAVSGVSGVNILGAVSDDLCVRGVTDSAVYLKKALETLGEYHLTHVSISVEAKSPNLSKYVELMKSSIARHCGLDARDVGLTATSGEGLTEFGRGEGMQALVIVTAVRSAH